MSNEIFTFKSGSVRDVVAALSSKRGLAVVGEVAHDFHSLAAVIAASHPTADGASTVIALPNHDTLTLAGLSAGAVRADAKTLGHLFFG